MSEQRERGKAFQGQGHGSPVRGRRGEATERWPNAANDETAGRGSGTLRGAASENSAKQRARTPARADDGCLDWQRAGRSANETNLRAGPLEKQSRDRLSRAQRVIVRLVRLAGASCWQRKKQDGRRASTTRRDARWR